MKAVVMKEYRKPLVVEEWDKPEPGPGEVVVEIEMTGICYRDILTVDGFFPRAKPPLILGHEIAGRIVEVGEGVKEFSIGERVASLTYIPCGECEYCRRGEENLCRNRRWFGEDLHGSYAQYVNAHVRSLVKVPDNIPPEAAAISACVTGMLVHALKTRGRLREGERVLVTGAGGGVGVHAVQLAKTYGAEVLAVTSSEEKARRLRELGVDHVIVSGDGRFSREVKSATGGEGVDLALDCVGLTVVESVRSLRWGGRVIQVGNVKPEPIPIPLGLLILKENNIAGSLSCTKRELEEALRLHSEGKVRAVATTMPLEEAEKAHRMIRERRHFGRITLKP